MLLKNRNSLRSAILLCMIFCFGLGIYPVSAQDESDDNCRFGACDGKRITPDTTVEEVEFVLGRPPDNVRQLTLRKLEVTWYTTENEFGLEALVLRLNENKVLSIQVGGTQTLELLKRRGVAIPFSNLIGQTPAEISESLGQTAVWETSNEVRYDIADGNMRFLCFSDQEPCFAMIINFDD